jgi:hypothetical protein
MTDNLGYVLLIGFGSMKLTEFYKEITRRMGLHQPGWWKSFVNLCCVAVLSLLIIHRDLRTRVLIALAAAGLAALLHALDTVLRSHRDEMVTIVMDKTRSRRR